MKSKMFEVRDRGTFIPVLATRLEPSCEGDRYLLARAGYGVCLSAQMRYVLLSQVTGGGGRVEYSPYEWGGRTLPVAHQYILDHFDELDSGAVVDVQFILGETVAPEPSESEMQP